MQDYELDAYLGGAEVTPPQREAVRRALDMVAARFPEQGDPDATLAAAMAAQVIIQGNIHRAGMVEPAARWAEARRVERERWAELVGAMIAAAVTGMPETHIAESAGVTRVTVRRALGK